MTEHVECITFLSLFITEVDNLRIKINHNCQNNMAENPYSNENEYYFN